MFQDLNTASMPMRSCSQGSSGSTLLCFLYTPCDSSTSHKGVQRKHGASSHKHQKLH
jgi:hypothetical protein